MEKELKDLQKMSREELIAYALKEAERANKESERADKADRRADKADRRADKADRRANKADERANRADIRAQKTEEKLKIAEARLKKINDLLENFFTEIKTAIKEHGLRLKAFSSIDVIPDLRDFDAYISFVNNKFQSVYHCLIRMAHEGIKGLNSKSEKFPMGTNADNSSQPSDTSADENYSEKEATFEGQSGSEENQTPSGNNEAGIENTNQDNNNTFEAQISKIASDTLDKTTALNNRAFKAIAKLKEQSEGESAGKEKDSSAGKSGKSGTSDKAGDSGKDKQPASNDSKPNPQQQEQRLKKKEEKDQALIKKGESTVLELLHSGLPGLDEQSALNDIFAGNNRSSKDNHHSDHKEYGYLSPAPAGAVGIGRNEDGKVWCPYCNSWEDADEIYEGDHSNTVIHIEAARTELLSRLIAKYKCKKCGHIITPQFKADVQGMYSISKNSKANQSIPSPEVYNKESKAQKEAEKKLIAKGKEPRKHLKEEDSILYNGMELFLPEHKLSPLALSLCSILKLRPVGFDFETAERFPLVDGGSLTIGAAALLADMRCSLNTPYSREFGSKCFDLPKSTCFEAMKTLSRYSTYIAARIIYCTILRNSTVVHMDESNVHVREANSNGTANSMFTAWQISSGELENERLTCFRIDESHAQAVAMDILNDPEKNFALLMTDGNVSYNEVATKLEVVHVYCLAHTRRSFLKAMQHMGIDKIYERTIKKCSCYRDFPEKFAEEISAEEEALSDDSIKVILIFFYINCIFALEHNLSLLDPDYLAKVKTIRENYTRVYLDKINNLVDSLTENAVIFTIGKDGRQKAKNNGQCQYGDALVYWLERKDGIAKIIDYPECPLTNAVAELAFRDFSISKHSFYFIDTIDGCTTLASHLSVTYSCYRNGVDPYDYIVWFTYNLYARYVKMHPNGKICAPKPDYIPLADIPMDERIRYKTKVIDGMEYAIISIYDKRYHCMLDDVPTDGLSILDYKKQCLKGYVE